MEGEKSKSKVKYYSVKDKSYKLKIDALVKAPSGGTNYVFWVNEESPLNWGLTIKQTFSKSPKATPVVVWKASWIFDAETKVLNSAGHCKTIVENVDESSSAQVLDIFNYYSN